jgi:hypothetical protein
MRYAPGNHSGPNRSDKGELGGACNVTACQLPNSARFFNHSTRRHYCRACAEAINIANRDDEFVKKLGHDLCTEEGGGLGTIYTRRGNG